MLTIPDHQDEAIYAQHSSEDLFGSNGLTGLCTAWSG